MSTFIAVFPWAISLLLVFVFALYAVLFIFGSSRFSLGAKRGIHAHPDLTKEQKENFEKSLMSGRVSTLLARSNLMCVAGILSYILDVFFAQEQNLPVVTANFYFTLVLICITIAVMDLVRYHLLKNKK